MGSQDWADWRQQAAKTAAFTTAGGISVLAAVKILPERPNQTGTAGPNRTTVSRSSATAARARRKTAVCGRPIGGCSWGQRGLTGVLSPGHPPHPFILSPRQASLSQHTAVSVAGNQLTPFAPAPTSLLAWRSFRGKPGCHLIPIYFHINVYLKANCGPTNAATALSYAVTAGDAITIGRG
jgi:hypothetical protein